MTDTTETAITYSVADVHGYQSGVQTCLYLIPSKESKSGGIEIYLWHHIGAGMPMPAYHGLWFCLGSPGTTFEAESLIEELKMHEDTFREIDAEYLNNKWDGHNNVGKWSETALLNDDWNQIGSECRENCNHYWEPCEWFQGSLSDIELNKPTIRDIAEHEADCADGAILNVDDCETWLRSMIEQRAEELRDIDERDEDEESELAGLERLLAT